MNTILCSDQPIGEGRGRSHLEDGLHVRAYEAGRVGDQVSQHAGALLLVAAHAAVFQLRQDLERTQHNTQSQLSSFTHTHTHTHRRWRKGARLPPRGLWGELVRHRIQCKFKKKEY